jgi:hypothetical protein
MSTRGTITAALLAQVGAQALTAWAILAHLAEWPEVSIWVVLPMGAAMLVPFRHDGSLRDRAVGNFGSASVVAGMMLWEVLAGSVDGILGGTAPSVGAFTLLTLVASVLFSAAGAGFWLHREDAGRTP